MSESTNPSRADEARRFRFPPEQLAAAKGRIVAQGVTIAGWAEANGFNRYLVYAVLGGRKACHYGTTHNIAVALGLKQSPQSARAVLDVRP